MFESLDDEIRRDDRAASTPREKWLQYAVVVVLATVLFGGLYAGIKYLG